MWCVSGMAMASCPAIARPSGSNGNERNIASRSIGMVARAFTVGAGLAVGSAHAGRRHRLEMYGTAADSGVASPAALKCDRQTGFA